MSTEPTASDIMMMEVDSDLVEIYQSWFETERLIDFDMSDDDREMIFLHMRMAFVRGRRMGREDMQPIIEEHACEIRNIAAALREL